MRNVTSWMLDHYWVWLYPLVVMVFVAGWFAINHWVGGDAAWAFVATP